MGPNHPQSPAGPGILETVAHQNNKTPAIPIPLDCWGKFLDVDKIMIAKVPSSSPQSSKYEAVANYFKNQTSSWGNKYQVYCSKGQPYTNFLILNKKVLVPITGSSDDSAALTSYKDAMPGYEVLGFTGNWQTTDALHCRTKGIADRKMVVIKHMPLLGEKALQSSYTINAEVTSCSGNPLASDSPKIYYRINTGSYNQIAMSSAGGNTYTGAIPAQSGGSEIGYYISASDTSGKAANHPFIGSPDLHTFIISQSQTGPSANFTSSDLW